MKIDIAPIAYEDLKDIYSYISNKLTNPTAAERTVKKITQSYLLLADSPYIGASLKSKLQIDTPYRFLVSGNYLIFYLIKEDRVIISRIIYGRRNYSKLFFNSALNQEDSEE